MADARVIPWAKFPATKKAAKYRNVKTVIDGIKFDSKREAEYYLHLRVLERTGKICNLRRQVPYEIVPSVVLDGRKRPARKFIADFVYLDKASGVDIVVDVKGVKTDVYTLKRHLMKSVHGIEVKEV